MIAFILRKGKKQNERVFVFLFRRNQTSPKYVCTVYRSAEGGAIVGLIGDCWLRFLAFSSRIPSAQGLWWGQMLLKPLLEVAIFLSRFQSVFCTLKADDFPVVWAVWKVMEMCFQILVQEKRVTQRELFYKLLCSSPKYFTSQLQVNRTIQGHFYSPLVNSLWLPVLISDIRLCLRCCGLASMQSI